MLNTTASIIMLNATAEKAKNKTFPIFRSLSPHILLSYYYFTITLREEILAGRKFGGFGGFDKNPPN